MGEHKMVVRQFYDRFGDGDLEGAVAAFAPEVTICDPGLGTVEGLEAVRSYLVELKDAVPDARAIVEQVFEVDDMVIVEGRFTGTTSTDTSEPGTGCRSPGGRIDLPFADFARIAGGRIAEYRTYYDQVALLTQLGEMPAPQ